MGEKCLNTDKTLFCNQPIPDDVPIGNPSSYDSMDSDGAGLNRSEEPCTAATAGGGEPEGSQQIGSRHILINCHQIPSERDTIVGEILGKIYHSPIMNEYYDTVVDFINWMERTKDLNIVIRGYTNYPNDSDIEPFTEFEYKKKAASRWSEDYQKKLLARLYRLKDEMAGKPCLMGSFTVPHEYNSFGEMKNPGNNHEWCFRRLQIAFDLFRKRYHKRFRKNTYVRIWEAHPKSGYPHFHAVLYGQFTDKDKDWMSDTWAECIGYPSSASTSLKFSKTRSIEYPVAYLMKYISKSLYGSYLEWSAEEWVFYSLLWKFGIRSFNASQDLTKLMADKNWKNTENRYTAILAEGLDRKSDDNKDLPVLLSVPAEGERIRRAETRLNPHIAPYIPLCEMDIPLKIETASQKAVRWLSTNPAVHYPTFERIAVLDGLAVETIDDLPLLVPANKVGCCSRYIYNPIFSGRPRALRYKRTRELPLTAT